MKDDMPKPDNKRVVFNEHAAQAYRRDVVIQRACMLGRVASWVVCGALGAACEWYLLWSGCHGG